MIKNNFIVHKEVPAKVEEIDGPPLDYSFKNIRVLSCTNPLTKNYSPWTPPKESHFNPNKNRNS